MHQCSWNITEQYKTANKNFMKSVKKDKWILQLTEYLVEQLQYSHENPHLSVYVCVRQFINVPRLIPPVYTTLVLPSEIPFLYFKVSFLCLFRLLQNIMTSLHNVFARAYYIPLSPRDFIHHYDVHPTCAMCFVQL